MSRAVTADHVLFDECIALFRPEEMKMDENDHTTTGYLLIDFHLTEELVFEYFTIKPSIEVKGPGAYSSFIAPVLLPTWFSWYDEHNAHLFTIALASVFSFITNRPVRAPRDGYISRREQLDENSLYELAIQFPILTAGPGAHETRISKYTLDNINNDLKEMLRILHGVPYKIYVNTMQSIRLVHLSHLNKRDDFGLAYYLLVSAIETMAQRAIKKKKLVTKHEKENEWKELANTDENIKELLHLYKHLRNESESISKRFVAFIMEYCPPDQWEDLEHPEANRVNYMKEHNGTENNFDWLLEKSWFEKYPSDLHEDEKMKIINNIYKYRSKYAHRGESPPNKDPNSHNRFFDSETLYKEKNGRYTIEEITLPNFQLISFIANRSIQNYLLHVYPK
ncbi:hypothetical protein CAR_50p450 (plasmid) [Carnobacterium sp. 17-4]|uniref:hypothetical protein n=1 Tax=Carnobacterium sp. (strain 17-4) TaxID=208596 RepID=UPI00020584A7|nr:hypothetical protein [Carnobacterium sp. 17-4]AEB31217.1 hypothetical protein CAR_50p450 [Carnobacterium sp. 17-4]